MDGFSERLAAEEAGIGMSMEAFLKCLELQKGLFHRQVDEMQKIVESQCNLTGSNPLSQEMAAGALSIPIGKKPRDLLNPKAVAYMEAVFAVKDKISKKETREINAQFGITLAQVRDFFSSQRARVRDTLQSLQVVHRDRPKLLKELNDENPENKEAITLSDPALFLTTSPITVDTKMLNATPEVNETSSQKVSRPTETDVSTLRCDSPEFSLATCIPITEGEDVSDEPSKIETVPQQSLSSTFVEPLPLNVVPLLSIEPLDSNLVGASNHDAQSKLKQEDIVPGLDGSVKNFVENIFNLMSKEKTFSGQVKLMNGILKIEDQPVLEWFLTKGGVMFLATWLGEAAIEEQTSVLHVILKVLCHLPLAKSVPEHMSVILQSVNSLRFYRTQEISKKARILLARWSKLFAKSQPVRKRNGVKSQNDVAKQTLLSQSINEIISDESRQSQLENKDGNLTSSNQPIGNIRKREHPMRMELLTSSAEEPIKKKPFGLLSSQGKDRRKVQLVDHPGQKLTSRSQQTARVSASQSRPVSTDDIQKAKLRKEYLEAKYGKKKLESESDKQGISQASRVPTQAIPNKSQPIPHEPRNPRSSLPKNIVENKPTIRPHPIQSHEKRQNTFPSGTMNELKEPILSLQACKAELEQSAVRLLDNTFEQPMTRMSERIAEPCMVTLSSTDIQSRVYPKNGDEQSKFVSISSRDAKPQVSSKGADEQRQSIVPDSKNITQQQIHQEKKIIPESKEPFSSRVVEPQVNSKDDDEQRQTIVPDSKCITQEQIHKKKKTIPETKEPFWKQCKRVQIPWKTPPVMIIDREWRVGVGQNSRELRDQKTRNKREKEFMYQRPDEIPQNPKNPWEKELDYDDSLTPVISIEQASDPADTSQTQNSMPGSVVKLSQMTSVAPTSVPTPLPGGVSETVHDPVLLDALLKNPALVFTLTAGQGNNMTSEDTVRLLDLIKATGGSLPTGGTTHSIANGVGVAEERVEASLPSPTPSSNYGTGGWQPDDARNPFSRNSPTPNTVNCPYPGVAGAAPAYDTHTLAAINSIQTQLASASNLQQLQSPTPHYPSPQIFCAQYDRNFTNSVLHSPTPHADAISSTSKPYHHPTSNETNMLEKRAAVGYNPTQIYSSYSSGQAHQPSAYDHLSQPAYHTSGQVQSQQMPIYERQSNLHIQTYATRREYTNPGSFSDSWRPARGVAADSYAQVNSNHYGSTDWYKNDNVTSLNQYESWSPPRRGPSMSVNYVSGSSQSQPRTTTAYGSIYRPDQSRSVRFPSGYGDTNQHGNGWWNEHDRKR